MEKYGLIIQLLATFNALHEGFTKDLFTYETDSKYLYICGLPTNLANLYCTLWSNVHDCCFYLEKMGNETVIKVMFRH